MPGTTATINMVAGSVFTDPWSASWVFLAPSSATTSSVTFGVFSV